MEFDVPTSSHFIFIPVMLIIGLVLGWILGSRAAQDAMAMELKRRDEHRDKAEGRSQR